MQGKRRGARGVWLGGAVAAYATSIFGDRVAELALPVAVLAVTGQPVAAGAVGAATQLPVIALSLLAGGWVDRYSRRALAVAADVLRAGCFTAYALLAAAAVNSLWPYLAVGLLVGSANVVFSLSTQALLPRLVARGSLARANAVLELADASTTAAGPAVGGMVLARAGAAGGLVLNAASFAVSAVLLRWTLPGERTPPRAADVTSAAISASTGLDAATVDRVTGAPASTQDVPRASRRRRAGAVGGLARLERPLRIFYGDHLQAGVQVAVLGLNVHSAAVVLTVVVLARSTLSLPIAEVGLVLAAAGVGGVLVGLLATRYPRPFSTPQAMPVSVALTSAALLSLAAAPGFGWALAGNAVVDAAATAGFIATATVRQQRTDPTVLGRVLSASMVSNAVARLGSVALVGALLSLYGARTTLIGVAAVLAVAAALSHTLITAKSSKDLRTRR